MHTSRQVDDKAYINALARKHRDRKKKGQKKELEQVLFFFFSPTITLPVEAVAARRAVEQRSRPVGAMSDYPPRATSR